MDNKLNLSDQSTIVSIKKYKFIIILPPRNSPLNSTITTLIFQCFSNTFIYFL